MVTDAQWRQHDRIIKILVATTTLQTVTICLILLWITLRR